MARFVKFNPDSDLFLVLISQGYHHEIALLSLMACRARRAYCPVTKLSAGECYLGDLGSMGLTDKQYRTAKSRLQEFGLAAFKGSRKGTIGKLLTSDIYDINAIISGEQKDEQGDEQKDEQKDEQGDEQKDEQKDEQGDEQGDEQRASRGASNKNKNDKNKNKNKNGGERNPHTLPADFSITPEMRQWAESKNLTINLDEATERWMNAMEAKGQKYKNWVYAWRNGMNLAQKWQKDAELEKPSPAQNTARQNSEIDDYVASAMAQARRH